MDTGQLRQPHCPPRLQRDEAAGTVRQQDCRPQAFRAVLRRALDDLTAIGEIDGWDIDARDLVHITKSRKLGR